MSPETVQPAVKPSLTDRSVRELAERLNDLPPDRAALLLRKHSEEEAALALTLLTPATTILILLALPVDLRSRIAAAAPEGKGELWLRDREYPAGTVGRLMERPVAVFRPTTTLREATERLREKVKRVRVHYGFVTDDDGKLVGAFAFRELLFGRPEDPLSTIMSVEPFALAPGATVLEAVRQILSLPLAAFPVCDERGVLIGMVRARTLFQQEAFDVSSQAQRSVGVDSEERPATRWLRSLRSRHPWLQLNLLTTFGVAAIVGLFQGTLDQIVILALFIPVVCGQTANCGHQTLAVTLRGVTLGELHARDYARLYLKELWLGFVNGALCALVAGPAMFLFAWFQKDQRALLLGVVVALALTAACTLGGVLGAVIPLAFKRMGFDPATASAIFLTTFTDTLSIGFFLGLATLFLL